MRYKQDQENQRIKDEEIVLPSHTSTKGTRKMGRQNGENRKTRRVGNPSRNPAGEESEKGDEEAIQPSGDGGDGTEMWRMDAVEER
jgi:hypothetical protein